MKAPRKGCGTSHPRRSRNCPGFCADSPTRRRTLNRPRTPRGTDRPAPGSAFDAGHEQRGATYVPGQREDADRRHQPAVDVDRRIIWRHTMMDGSRPPEVVQITERSLSRSEVIGRWESQYRPDLAGRALRAGGRDQRQVPVDIGR